jgi:hypothetical protein
VNERPTAQHPPPPVQIRHRTAVDPHDEHHLSNAGKPWSRKDEKRLVEAFKSTQDVPYVARLLQRTPNAIRIRLERLEISERPDRLRATPYS